MRRPKSSLLIIFLHSCWLSSIISNALLDTMTPNRTIAVNETIVSAEGIFELGFFNPAKGEKLYLGIWYKKISEGTVVWVANRVNPLTDHLGFLKMTNTGILELVTSNSTVIWSSNSSKPLENPVAELLDSGNFIVREAENDDSDPENYSWQSFDYLTDMLLPGMKFGRNLVTGLDWFMNSWKSVDDPSPGSFTGRIEMGGVPQMVLWQGAVEKSRSGPWIGNRFSGYSFQKPNQIYNYGFVSNQREIYYYTSSSVYTRLVLSPTGQLQRFAWVNRTKEWSLYSNSITDSCDTYALCGANGICDIDELPNCGCPKGFEPKFPKDWERADWLNGCARTMNLDCSTDGFAMYTGLKLPDTRNSWVSASMNLEQCRVTCLRNCSCTGYSNSDIREGGSGCLLWFGELVDVRKYRENGQDVYIRLAGSEIDQGVHGLSNKQKVIIIVTVTVVALLLSGLSYAYIVYWRKRSKQDRSKNHKNESKKGDADLPIYAFDTIASSTKNFSDDSKIGEGGYGPVYKGILEGGHAIAVKRLSKVSRQGPDEFKNEVNFIAKLQHRNLVKLLGWCIQEEDMMLIYEYMPNKSLDLFLFDKKRSYLLDWPKRFNIINGIARGLLYLHQDSRFRIVHRDLKVDNILLDNEMNPKISDFGMARTFAGDETQATTMKVVGTHGYIAPEYANRGLYSTKSDVYSFGVLVLEIVSGRRNRGFYHPDHSLDLLGHAWEYYLQGRSSDLIDATIERSCIISEVVRSVQVGLLCVQQRSEDRPTMSNVILMLGGELGTMPPPRKPAFFTGRSPKNISGSTSSNLANYSPNEITITDQLEPR